MDCTHPRRSKNLKAWRQQECWACETVKCWYSPVECTSVQSLEKKQKLALHKWKFKCTCWSAILTGSLKWLYTAWNCPGQNTGMGSCSLLHGIFLTQGSNPGLLHGRWILYQLSYQWSLRPSMDFYKYYILGWEGWEQNEHIYLHRFTTYLHKYMNQENEPIWTMQIWKWTTTKSSSNNCGLGKNNGGSHGKQFACNAGDSGLISGLGRVRGQGNGNSLQYSGLEYPQTEQPGRLESIAWLTVPIYFGC